MCYDILKKNHPVNPHTHSKTIEFHWNMTNSIWAEGHTPPPTRKPSKKEN